MPSTDTVRLPRKSADEICALLAADETWRERTLGEAA
jgi:hypothetical protein